MKMYKFWKMCVFTQKILTKRLGFFCLYRAKSAELTYRYKRFSYFGLCFNGHFWMVTVCDWWCVWISEFLQKNFVFHNWNKAKKNCPFRDSFSIARLLVNIIAKTKNRSSGTQGFFCITKLFPFSKQLAFWSIPTKFHSMHCQTPK